MATGEAPAAAPPPTPEGTPRHPGHRDRRPDRGRPQYRARRPAGKKFEGRCEALKGHVYDMTLPKETANAYTTTTTEIAEYIGANYKLGNYTKRSIETLSPVQPTKPAPLGTGADDTDKEIWKQEVAAYVKDRSMLKTNNQNAYSLIFGQCSEEIRAVLLEMDDHDQIATSGDPIGLLKNIRTIMFQFKTTKYMPQAIYECKRRVYTNRQDKEMSVPDYFRTFKNNIEVVQHNGGSFGIEEGLVAEQLKEVGSDFATATPAQLTIAQDEAKDMSMAVAFVLGADRGRFGKLIEDLENSYTQGTDKYPKTLTDAYKLLANWKQDIRPSCTPVNNHNNNTGSELAFANVDEDGKDDETGTALATVDTRGRHFPGVKCYNCNMFGHYAGNCPNASAPRDEAQLFMAGIEADDEVEFTFAMPHGIGGKLPRNWILLDNQSTVNIFYNKQLLKDVHETDSFVRVHCNAGVAQTNMVGTLPGFPGRVWYHPNGIANILSMSQVEQHFPVTYDRDNGFVITKPDGTTRQFTKSPRGLHYLDVSTTTMACTTAARSGHDNKQKDLSADEADNKKDEADNKKDNNMGEGTTKKTKKTNKTKKTKEICESKEQNERVGEDNKMDDHKTDTALVITVADKISNYTNKGYRRAELARKLQNIIGRPSTQDFLKIVGESELRNCPLNTTDVRAAEDVFGPNLGSLKGKTVSKPVPALNYQVVDLPPEIRMRYKDVTLAIDIMFVNKLAFLVTISHNIKFGTVEYIPTRTQDQILAAILRVVKLYGTREYKVNVIHADLEFEVLRPELSNKHILLNVASEGEHVPEVERYIRTVKERTRAIWNTIPFTRIPSRMIIEMVTSSVFWLNMFPARDGISDKLGPRAIITGLLPDYNKHCKIEFGAYVQTHEEHDNSMITRTTGAIALRPSGNVQGGYYFYSLTTGRRILRSKWTELPMPQDVIDRVHALARRSHTAAGIAFGWRDGKPIDPDDDDNYESEEDSDYEPDDEDDNEDEDSIPGVDPADHDAHEQGENDNVNDNQPQDGADAEADPNDDGSASQQATEVSNESDHDGSDEPEDTNDSSDHEEQADTAGVDAEHGENTGVRFADTVEIAGVAPKSEQATILQAEQLQRGTIRSGAVCQVQAPDDYSMLNYGIEELEHTALTQYSVKKGLQIFGRDGAEAVLSEMRQLHDMKALEPRRAEMLTREEKKRALEYLMFLKKKRCGRIKGRGCADGRKQRLYKSKEETSSPTVRTESLFLSCIIDAKEGRHVVTADIPGAFLQADMDEMALMRLSGPLATLVTKVDAKLYSKFVTMEKGKPVVYVRLAKALYGTLQASLLFWKDLTGELKKWGFELNPYDTCVANKMINNKQCTILWHVDDLKISHVDAEVVEDIISRLNERYGGRAPLTVTRGKVHEYLGMTIDYSVAGKVTIRMDEYVQEILDEARPDMDGESTTPAAEHLYEVNNDNPELLAEDTAQYFHTMVAKMLFLSKRARPDIQEAVAFLTTRVKRPDKDDYKKLGRAVKYLRATPTLALTLEADNTHVIKWWIDAAFAVHNDMRSQTGATMSLGKGSAYSMSTRQRLNTKSSTEAELVGMDDAMPMVLWTRYFLEAQGYEVTSNKVYQDNMSSMLLEKNGRASSGKRTRHINIRYFFVADRVKSNEISIEHCPTDEMVADYFTKPLQGAKFRRFRQSIMNLESTDASATTSMPRHRSVLNHEDLGLESSTVVSG